MPATDAADEGLLDALIIGAGPVGLTAALYLARFKRRFALLDAGEPRAAWIPESHNISFFGEGISGGAILDRARDAAARYGARPVAARAESLNGRRRVSWPGSSPRQGRGGPCAPAAFCSPLAWWTGSRTCPTSPTRCAAAWCATARSATALNLANAASP